MRIKVLSLILVIACCLLTMVMPVFAEEVSVEETPAIEIVIPEIQGSTSEPNAGSLLLDWDETYVPKWRDNDTCYRDQIPDLAQEVYDNLLQALETSDYTYIETNKGNFWQIEGLLNFEYVDSWDEYLAIRLQLAVNEWTTEVNYSLWLGINAFSLDHPEYFWIRPDYSGNYVQICNRYDAEKEQYIYQLRLDLNLSIQPGFENMEKIEAASLAIDKVIDQLIHETNDMPNLAKLSYWDNWLAANNEYNRKAGEVGYSDFDENYYAKDTTPWSVVSAFHPNEKPVCEGYAKALQLLCHEAGIPCVQVEGDAPGPHMWVAVQLEGKWYFCDPTFDDPNITNQDGEFLRSSTESQKTHFLSVQPNTHRTSMRKGMIKINGWDKLFTFDAPDISSKSYTMLVENETESWEKTETSISGVEIGKGRMMIAIYDQYNRMLASGFCSSYKWSEAENMYIAPEFSADVMKNAARIVRINVDDSDWIPCKAVKPIS